MQKTHVHFTMNLEVFDPEALYEAAAARLRDDFPDMSADDFEDMIGAPDDPDLTGCLQTLLDPGESPPGCQIEDSAAEKLFED